MGSEESIIGRYFGFEVRDWKYPIKGFLVDYSDDWVLILNNSREFIIDGYAVLSFKYYGKIDNQDKTIEKDIFTEEVLRLKGIPPIVPNSIPIGDLKSILSYATKKYGAFGLYRKDENTLYIGKLKSITSKQLVITFLDTRGKWAGPMKFRPGDIRVIEFGTDYINSLILVVKKTRK